MKIANQLFDRSALTLGKKDTKLVADKQATASTAASVPKKVIIIVVFLLVECIFREIRILHNRLE